MDGGGSPELGLYFDRCEIVGRAVWPELHGLMHEATDIAEDTELEAVEALYVRVSGLLRDACTRVQQQPAEYEHVLEWRNEVTIHGTGHPTLRDALFEAYHELWCNGYPNWSPAASSRLKEAEPMEVELEHRLVLMGKELHAMISKLPE